MSHYNYSDDEEEDELNMILEGRNYHDNDHHHHDHHNHNEEEEDELNMILEGRNHDDGGDARNTHKHSTKSDRKLSKSLDSNAKKSHINDKEINKSKRKLENDDYGDAFRYEIDIEPNDEDDNDGRMRPDEAIEVPDVSTKPKVPKPKRVVTNPQPKLDSERLMSKNGIILLPKLFDDCRLKGKGNEKSDLNKLMFKLEHWAHRLFPKMRFDDFIERTENLGLKKRQMKTFIKKIRYDLPIYFGGDEDIVENRDDSDDEIQKSGERIDAESAFDALFGNETVKNAKTTEISIAYDDDDYNFNDNDSLDNFVPHDENIDTVNNENLDKVNDVISEDISAVEKESLHSEEIKSDKNSDKIDNLNENNESSDEDMSEDEILRQLNTDD